jgi:hypothetical protein
MEPGRQMRFRVELVEKAEASATFKGKGEVDGQTTVAARLTLARYNLHDRDPALSAADQRIVQHLRNLYEQLRLKPAEIPAEAGS